MVTVTLAYHDVVAGARPDESGFPGCGPAVYKITWEAFAEHLDALDTAVGAPRLVTAEADGGWMMTFDDGGSCTLPVARLLAERGWAAHFFVSTALIGTPGFATEDELREVHRLGHLIGSHSDTHPTRISGLDAAGITGEWTRSIEALEALTGAPVTVGSVPGGYTSRRVEQAAAAAGLRALFTSAPSTRVRTVDSCRVLGRFDIRTETTSGCAAALVTGRGLGRAKHVAGWAALSVPRRLLGDHYPPLRRALLARRSAASCLAVMAASSLQHVVEAAKVGA